MKKSLCLLTLSFCLFGIIGITNAALVYYDDDTILDNVTGQLWWKDLTDFNNMNYNYLVNTKIPSLTGGGWSLASYDQIYQLLDLNGAAIGGAFIKCGQSNNVNRWQGRYALARPDIPEWHYVAFVYQNLNNSPPTWSTNKEYLTGVSTADSTVDWLQSAWVTKAAVPSPGAVWLLGSGLVGFVGIRMKLKK